MKEEGKDLPGGPGVRTPDWGTKIPHALRCGQFFFFLKKEEKVFQNRKSDCIISMTIQ